MTQYKVGWWHGQYGGSLEAPEDAVDGGLKRLRRIEAPERRLKIRGQDWAHWEGLPGLRDHLEHVLPRLDVGNVVLVESKGSELVLAIRVLEPVTAIAPTIGNEDIDRIVGFVEQRFPGADSYGICNRRPIDGTSTWTQHCPWPVDPHWRAHYFTDADGSSGSNAWDIGAPFALLERISDALDEQARLFWKSDGEDGLPIGRQIFDHHIWDPVQDWHPYGGSDPHDGHIHVEGAFERTGSPRASCP